MKRQSYLPVLALITLLTPTLEAQTLVVANKAEATVSLIDLRTGAVANTLPTGEGPHEVAVSRSGRRAVITDYGREKPGSTLTVIDIPSAKVLRTIDLGDYTRPHGVVWRGDRHVVVTAEGKKALIEVDVQSGEVVRAIPTEQEVSHMVAMSPDQKRAFVANIGSGSITVIDLEKGERVRNIPTGEGAEGIAVSHDGKQVWVTNRAADTVTVLDAVTLEKVHEFASEGFPIRAVATPNGSILVTHARAGDLAVYKTTTPGKGKRLDMKLKAVAVEDRLFGDRFGDSSVPIGVVTDRQGRRAFVAHANADVITEVDLESGETVRELKAGKEPDGMAYSPVVVREYPES